MTFWRLISASYRFRQLRWIKLLTYVLGLANGLVILSLGLPRSGLAQTAVVPDGTTETTVMSSGVTSHCATDCLITGSSAAGGNLFHSFSQFNIPAGVTVTFVDGGNRNIFTRVSVPDQASALLGSLAVSGSANFFLLNPAGISFGEEASLNLNGGSFVASTAERLTFEDSSQLIAGTPQTPVQLTISVPVGLQFGAYVAPISSQSRAARLPSSQPIANTLGAPAGLRVSPYNTLALVGGEISVEGGNLTALGGQVALGSVGPGSLVSLEMANRGIRLGYEEASLASIRLNGALLDVGGPGGGEINLRGDDLQLTDSGLFAATLGPIAGGHILLEANQLWLDGTTVQGITLRPAAGANVTLRADQISLRNGSVVSAETKGPGDSGHLSVGGMNQLQSRSVVLDRSFLGTEVGPGASGQGGDVVVNTGSLRLRNAGILSNTFGPGNGGNLAVTAGQEVILQGDSKLATTADEFWQNPSAPPGIGTVTPGVGRAGDISLRTSTVTVSDGSQVQATTFGAAGNGGNIDVEAARVILQGRSADGRSSGIFSQVERGKVTGNLPRQQGGEIVIEADSVQLLGGAVVSASALGGGIAGNVIIRNADLVELRGDEAGPSRIFVIGDGTGRAGNVELEANLLRLSQGQIAASTRTSDGGNVVLRLAESVVMRDRARISAMAGEGGSGGNITVEAPVIVAIPLTDSDLVASAVNGPGGRITLRSNNIFGLVERPARLGNGTNDIDASSQFGADGTVALEKIEADPGQGLAILSAAVVDPAYQVGQTCGSQSATTVSRFTVSGRGGLPPTTELAIRERQLFADFGATAAVEGLQAGGSEVENTELKNPESEATALVEAQGWVINKDGEIALVSEPLQGSDAATMAYRYADCQGLAG